MTTSETYSFVGQNVPSIRMDESARLDYTFNWSDWLHAVADSIASRTVTVDGVTKVSDEIINGLTEGGVQVNNSRVLVWLENPTKTLAKATCRIVTVAGRRDERSIYLLRTER